MRKLAEIALYRLELFICQSVDRFQVLIFNYTSASYLDETYGPYRLCWIIDTFLFTKVYLEEK